MKKNKYTRNSVNASRIKQCTQGWELLDLRQRVTDLGTLRLLGSSVYIYSGLAHEILYRLFSLMIWNKGNYLPLEIVLRSPLVAQVHGLYSQMKDFVLQSTYIEVATLNTPVFDYMIDNTKSPYFETKPRQERMINQVVTHNNFIMKVRKTLFPPNVQLNF